MTRPIDVFQKFLADEDAWEMYVSGEAGTGKTYSLSKFLEMCQDIGVATLTTAHTHKACKVIRETIGADKNISTLHSFLNKRPGINDEAITRDEVDFIQQMGVPDTKGVVFIDEYSMVAADDVKDIVLAQDPDYTGQPKFKVVYLGDPNQLPPVGEQVAVVPKGKYCVILDKVWRQAEDNPLMETLGCLIKYIKSEEDPKPLESNDSFLREQNLKDLFFKTEDPILLAYTNEAVENWNREIQGRDYIQHNDQVFSPTTRELYTYLGAFKSTVDITRIDLARDRTLALGTRYKTLEFLLELDEITFGKFDGDKTFAFVFGHYQYKRLMERLTSEASMVNQEIQRRHNIAAKAYAESNPKDPIVRKRAKAWRKYLAIKDAVICVDFPYATTIHKAQGSTYANVLLDCQDLSKCTNYDTLLRLWYVALSRAQDKVYTN